MKTKSAAFAAGMIVAFVMTAAQACQINTQSIAVGFNLAPPTNPPPVNTTSPTWVYWECNDGVTWFLAWGMYSNDKQIDHILWQLENAKGLGWDVEAFDINGNPVDGGYNVVEVNVK